MSAEAKIYYFSRSPVSDRIDESEWLLSALSQFTGAELRELLYVAQEPEFFELTRALFALSEEARSVLLDFLISAGPQALAAAFDADGRCILRAPAQHPKKPV
jgi:hypothetical protein